MLITNEMVELTNNGKVRYDDKTIQFRTLEKCMKKDAQSAASLCILLYRCDLCKVFVSITLNSCVALAMQRSAFNGTTFTESYADIQDVFECPNHYLG